MSRSILMRVADGDESAMRECVDTYSGLIWRLAWRMLPSRQEAEDAVQEVFISLWESADRYKPEFGEETTFVAMIARRRLIDRGRRHQQRRRLHQRATERAEAGMDQPGVRSVAGATPEIPTADGPAADESLDRIREAMLQLPEKQRLVLELALRGDASHSELSEQLDMPLGTVKTLIRRGLIRLRDLVNEVPANEGSAA